MDVSLTIDEAIKKNNPRKIIRWFVSFNFIALNVSCDEDLQLEGRKKFASNGERIKAQKYAR